MEVSTCCYIHKAARDFGHRAILGPHDRLSFRVTAGAIFSTISTVVTIQPRVDFELLQAKAEHRSATDDPQIQRHTRKCEMGV